MRGFHPSIFHYLPPTSSHCSLKLGGFSGFLSRISWFVSISQNFFRLVILFKLASTSCLREIPWEFCCPHYTDFAQYLFFCGLFCRFVWGRARICDHLLRSLLGYLGEKQFSKNSKEKHDLADIRQAASSDGIHAYLDIRHFNDR